jgi:general secretion pathway protein D
MKTILSVPILAVILAVTGLTAFAQVPPPANPGGGLRGRPALYPQGLNASSTSAGSQVAGGDEIVPANYINWEGIDAATAVDIYAKLINRTVLRGPLPEAKIILHTHTDLTKTEVIEAIEAVLAINNISVIKVGDKFLKVLPSEQANTAGAPIDYSSATNLPNLGSYVTHIAQLHYVKPSIMAPLIQPFARLQGGLSPIDDNGILVMRDYAENIKRMLEMIDEIDISVPTEYISEVVPIRYAKVDEIASALQSLGGGGGPSVSIGTAPSASRVSGLSSGGMGGGGGFAGMSGQSGGGYNSGGGIGGASSFGANRPTGATANGTPTTGTSFQQRLNNILSQSGGGSGGAGGNKQDIQLFGQTKIIPNESSSTLLIYATRQDMDAITNIIAKLDVPLAQVLIEAAIIDVTLGNTFNFGVSASQKPQSLGGNNIGGGGINNGQTFANFMQSVITGTNSLGIITNATTIISSVSTNGSAFNSSLPGGLSYFGSLGPVYDVAIQAAESDSHASIIQRPRIQASQATPATFFVGETKPYVTSTYNNGYNGGYGGSSYSQLSVGVELDVTPFINPDGEVAMQIQQEIDDFNGTTTIAGVGDVPNTIKRTLNTSITVRDRDAVMLGSFIKSDKSTSKSGVPFLVDIPLLGNLFSSRNDAKDRQELIVLMRPTVMRTPALAAKNTIEQSKLLPGVSGAAAEDAQYQHDLIEAERKRELRAAKNGSNTNGFFNILSPDDISTNTPFTGVTNAPAYTPGNTPDPTPASALVDPSGAAMDKAREQFKERSSFADGVATGKLTKSQKKALDVLLNQYMAGKITQEQYRAARDKIMATVDDQ